MRCDGIYNEPAFQQRAGYHNTTSHVSPHPDLHAFSRLVSHGCTFNTWSEILCAIEPATTPGVVLGTGARISASQFQVYHGVGLKSLVPVVSTSPRLIIFCAISVQFI